MVGTKRPEVLLRKMKKVWYRSHFIPQQFNFDLSFKTYEKYKMFPNSVFYNVNKHG